MVDLEQLLPALNKAGVELIIVGGVAAIVHGSARLTQDLDIVYRRNPDNIGRLATALKPFAPYLRDAPPGLPFRWDAETIQRGLNFTLTTSAGPLDVLGEIAGGGTYETLFAHSRKLSVFGIECYCLGLDRLIQAKRDAGRPKDLEVIAELEALREE
jgi:predicted nucleotidyltransferase